MVDEQSGSNVVPATPRRGAGGPVRQISQEAQLVRSVFRAAGRAAGTVVRGSQWVVNTSYGVTRELAQAALETESTADFAERTSDALRTVARTALGVGDPEPEIIDAEPAPAPGAEWETTITGRLRSASSEALRRRGDALLAKSADIGIVDEVHPAYDRILDELAPDEARILRFMARNGPQPVVDVRTNRPLGIGSELIVSNLTSVPEQAGVRYPSRARSYIINLSRLGLTHNSAEPVPLRAYMVLEVQPAVEQALKRAGRAPKIIRKSLRLTEFGADFCRTCFTLDR